MSASIEVRTPPSTDPVTGAVSVILRVSPLPQNGRLAYAAAPPADSRASFSGSGMPFVNAKEALESKRASRGVANVELDGTFLAVLSSGMPGSYYSGLGTTLVPPSVHVTYLDADGGRVRHVAPVGVESIPHRTLSYAPERKSAGSAFYQSKAAIDEVRPQDDILKQSAWKRDAPSWASSSSAFWGGKPPL
jgi:hypothetical protein